MEHRRPPAGSIARLASAWSVAAVLALGAIGAASGASPPPEATPPPVRIVDFAFEPATITIRQHQVVSWQNDGPADHTVTADDGSFDSGPLARGDVFGHVFDTPGTFAYGCTIHPTQMRGTVVVIAVAGTPTPSGPLAPVPPPGTLPPDFKTRVPVLTAEPTATPTEAPVPAPTNRQSDLSDTTAGTGLVLTLGIAAALALVAAVIMLGRRRRGP